MKLELFTSWDIWEGFAALKLLIKEVLLREHFDYILPHLKIFQSILFSFVFPFASITSEVGHFCLWLLMICIFSPVSLDLHQLQEVPEGIFLALESDGWFWKSRSWRRRRRGLGKKRGRGSPLFFLNLTASLLLSWVLSASIPFNPPGLMILLGPQTKDPQPWNWFFFSWNSIWE